MGFFSVLLPPDILQPVWNSMNNLFTQGSVVLENVDTFGFCLHGFLCPLFHLCLFHFLLSLRRFNKDLFILHGRGRGLWTLKGKKTKDEADRPAMKRCGFIHLSLVWHPVTTISYLNSSLRCCRFNLLFSFCALFIFDAVFLYFYPILCNQQKTTD